MPQRAPAHATPWERSRTPNNAVLRDRQREGRYGRPLTLMYHSPLPTQAVSHAASTSAVDTHHVDGGGWRDRGGYADGWYPEDNATWRPTFTVGEKIDGIVRADGWVRHTQHCTDRYHEENTKQLAAGLGHANQCVLVITSSSNTLAGAERYCEHGHPPGAPQHSCWFKQCELFAAMGGDEKYCKRVHGSRVAAGETRSRRGGSGGKGRGGGGGKGGRGGDGGRGAGKGAGKGAAKGGGKGGRFKWQVART